MTTCEELGAQSPCFRSEVYGKSLPTWYGPLDTDGCPGVSPSFPCHGCQGKGGECGRVVWPPSPPRLRTSSSEEPLRKPYSYCAPRWTTTSMETGHCQEQEVSIAIGPYCPYRPCLDRYLFGATGLIPRGLSIVADDAELLQTLLKKVGKLQRSAEESAPPHVRARPGPSRPPDYR